MPDEDLTIRELHERLREAEETIRAIHLGEADAVVVEGSRGPQVYTLQGADHMYRALLENMREGTVSLDTEGLILYTNPMFAAMVEVPASEVTGSDFQKYLAPASVSSFAALMEAAAARGHTSGELNLRVPQEGRIPVRLSLTQVDCAEMRCVSVLVSDLREQIRNEAILREEQLSRLILNQAGEAVVVIDPEGTILRRSESARMLAGASVMLDHFDRVFPLIASGISLTAREILLRTRNGKPLRGLEAHMAHPDGRVSALLVSASPLWSNPRELLGCVITLTDITELKRARDELMRQSQELAQSNNDLRQFAYSASHDLREPLRQLAVFSELIQKRFGSALGPDGGELIQHAVDGAHRLEKLLQDLLAYIQAADAPQEVPATADANEVVRKVLATFHVETSRMGARIESGPLPVLGVHEVHLVQLFQNLIGNALKYHGENEPEIRIGAEPGQGLWKLWVEDNGIGISPDYQKQIFGLFQRLHGGNKYSGSGIGLAICQRIVQRYGCKIWVESQAGLGSKFFFTLPGAET